MTSVILKTDGRSNQRWGVFMGCIGICGLIGGIFAVAYHPTALPPVAQTQLSKEACLSAFKGLKFNTGIQGSQVLANIPMQGTPRQMLAEASLGIALCHPGYTLSKFCMGLGCAQPGLHLVMVPTPH